MAEPQSNARLRADAGLPTSGVIHVRTRLTADFTVIANALAQRRGSAVTVGVATYILSLPDGAPVSIAALCAHFTEGEILISRALKDLEEAGYLERVRERGSGGLIRTRTYFHGVPGQGRPSPPPPTPRPTPLRPRKPTADDAPPRAPRPEAAPDTGPAAGPDTGPAATVEPGPALPPEPASAAQSAQSAQPAQGPVPPPAPVPSRRPPDAPSASDRGAAADAGPPPSLADADPLAVVILASLRIRDRRLILSRREVTTLAPAVTRWLAQGAGPEEITDVLTTGLPDHFRARPARILAFRLRDLPVAAPVPPAKSAVLPWQTCDGGCERAFRAAEPGRCRDCPPEDEMPAASASASAAASGQTLPVAS